MAVALFDIDGTIVTKTTRAPTSKQLAFTDALQTVYGVSGLNYMDYPIFGLTDPGILYLLLNDAGLSDAAIAAKETEFTDVLIQCNRELAAGCEPQYGPLPGAADLLGMLRDAGIRLGLATGNYEPIARFKLEDAGLADYFAFGGYGDSGADRACIVADAVKRSGETTPDAVVLLGDTPHDVDAGRRNGIHVKAVATGRFSVSQLIEATGNPNDVFADFSDPRAVADHLLDCIRRKNASPHKTPEE